MADYPGTLPTLPTDSANADPATDTHPALHNDANDEINAIATELGTNPSGADATVAERIAASTASLAVYRALLRSTGRATTAAASGNSYLAIPGQADITSLALTAAGQFHIYAIRLASADLAISGKTTKLRVEMIEMNAGIPPAVTLTAGLYPATTSGSNLVAGTRVSGSDAAIASPAGNSINSAVSSDFDVPADGIYLLGFAVNGTPAAPMNMQLALSMRHT